MKNFNRTRFFSNLCIAVVFCVTLNECTYTDRFMEEIYIPALQQENENFMEYEMRHATTVGEENTAGFAAASLFMDAYVPKIFQKCRVGDKNRYYTILQFEDKIRVPRPNALQELFMPNRYKYVPYHQYYAYSKLETYGKVIQSSNKGVLVEVSLSGLNYSLNDWRRIGKFNILINYSLDAIIDIHCIEGAKYIPVFGKGVNPVSMGSSCEFLQSNIGKRL